MQQILKNQATAALRRIPFLVVDDTYLNQPVTGLILSSGNDLTLSRNGASEENSAGSWVEVGNGKYYYQAAVGEVDTEGYLQLVLNVPGARLTEVTVQILASAAFDDPLAQAVPGAYAAGTAGRALGTYLDVAVSSRAATGAAMTLTGAERNAVADALLKRDWTAVTGEAARSVLNALRPSRNRWKILGGIFTAYKEDDTTSAFTAVVSTTAGSPVSEIDPT